LLRICENELFHLIGSVSSRKLLLNFNKLQNQISIKTIPSVKHILMKTASVVQTEALLQKQYASQGRGGPSALTLEPLIKSGPFAPSRFHDIWLTRAALISSPTQNFCQNPAMSHTSQLVLQHLGATLSTYIYQSQNLKCKNSTGVKCSKTAVETMSKHLENIRLDLSVHLQPKYISDTPYLK
jgi:hypothetical protein